MMKIDFELKLPAEQKDEFGYTPSQNKEIEKVITRPKPPKGLWKNFVKHSKETDNKEEALAKALIESNRLAESESPKQTWDRLEANEKKRVKLFRKEIDEKAAEKAKEKKHLNHNSSDPLLLLTGISIMLKIILGLKI